jgi:hypothetical protein
VTFQAFFASIVAVINDYAFLKGVGFGNHVG